MKPVLIIGTGLAGYNLARELRKLDANMPLQIVTSDDGHFYSKPMLSNALTNNKTPSDLAIASAEQMSQQLNATIHTNKTITAIDTASQLLETGKDVISYDKLVLTGITAIEGGCSLRDSINQ
jgi:rubredoxin-NAD+ reductase